MQDIFLDGGANPPHGISGEPEAAIRIEPPHRLHHADIAFRDQLGNRQAVTAIPHRDLGDEPQMRVDELMSGLLVTMVTPGASQPLFLLVGQHGIFADFLHIARQTAIRRQIRHHGGHVCTPFSGPAALKRRAGGPRPFKTNRNYHRLFLMTS
jgi:hypothetical protein